MGVFLVLGALFGLGRGFKKSWIRLIFVAGCAIAAFFLCKWLINPVSNIRFGGESLNSLLNGAADDVLSDAAELESLRNIAFGLIRMVVQMVLFFVIFFLLEWLTLIPYAIVTRKMKASKSANKKRSRLLGMATGAIQGLLIAAIILSPFSGIVGFAKRAAPGLLDKPHIAASQDGEGNIIRNQMDFVYDILYYTNNSFAYKILDPFGLGGILFNGVTSVKVQSADGSSERIRMYKLANTIGKVTAEIENFAFDWENGSQDDFKSALDAAERIVNAVFDDPIIKLILADLSLYSAEHDGDLTKFFGDSGGVFGDEDLDKALNAAVKDLLGDSGKIKAEVLGLINVAKIINEHDLITQLIGNVDTDTIFANDDLDFDRFVDNLIDTVLNSITVRHFLIGVINQQNRALSDEFDEEFAELTMEYMSAIDTRLTSNTTLTRWDTDKNTLAQLLKDIKHIYDKVFQDSGDGGEDAGEFDFDKLSEQDFEDIGATLNDLRDLNLLNTFYVPLVKKLVQTSGIEDAADEYDVEMSKIDYANMNWIKAFNVLMSLRDFFDGANGNTAFSGSKVAEVMDKIKDPEAGLYEAMGGFINRLLREMVSANSRNEGSGGLSWLDELPDDYLFDKSAQVGYTMDLINAVQNLDADKSKSEDEIKELANSIKALENDADYREKVLQNMIDDMLDEGETLPIYDGDMDAMGDAMEQIMYAVYNASSFDADKLVKALKKSLFIIEYTLGTEGEETYVISQAHYDAISAAVGASVTDLNGRTADNDKIMSIFAVKGAE